MLKPTGNLKLSKSAKRQLATEPNAAKRGALKAGHIQAELAAAIQPKRERRPEGRAVNGPDSLETVSI
jgi:hypothetical protein